MSAKGCYNMFLITVFTETGAIIDKWAEQKSILALARINQDEKLFKLSRKRDYYEGANHYFEYTNGYKAQIEKI